MNKHVKQIVLTLIIILSSTSIFAQKEVAGVSFKDTVHIDGEPLVLNGAGVRSKYLMNMYTAAVYLNKKSENAYGIVHADETQAVRLKIISNMVTRERFCVSTIEGFEVSMGGDTSPLDKEITTLMASLQEEFLPGDYFEYDYRKSSGMTIKKNGEIIAIIPGLAFKQAMLGIWLGEKPADHQLKNGMLGK